MLVCIYLYFYTYINESLFYCKYMFACMCKLTRETRNITKICYTRN